MTTIFMDECGYTGTDLLNPRQPVFVLTSLRLDEEEAEQLAHQFFGTLQSRELKHAALARHPRNQRSILAFLEYLRAHPEHVRFAFGLVDKILDLVLESCAAAAGVSSYLGGGNLTMPHSLFYLTPRLFGAGFFTRLLRSFQVCISTPGPGPLAELLEVVYSVDTTTDWVLGSLAQCLKRSGREFLANLTHRRGECLDLGPPMALRVMASWRADTTGPLRLVHDESSPFAKQQTFWDAVVDSTLAPALLGYDRRTVQFPIAVEETRLEPSCAWRGLQLADILAGALARCYVSLLNRAAVDTYADALAAIAGTLEPAACVWPEPAYNLEELGTAARNAKDPIAYLEPIMRRVREQQERS